MIFLSCVQKMLWSFLQVDKIGSHFLQFLQQNFIKIFTNCKISLIFNSLSINL